MTAALSRSDTLVNNSLYTMCGYCPITAPPIKTITIDGVVPPVGSQRYTKSLDGGDDDDDELSPSWPFSSLSSSILVLSSSCSVVLVGVKSRRSHRLSGRARRGCCCSISHLVFNRTNADASSPLSNGSGTVECNANENGLAGWEADLSTPSRVCRWFVLTDRDDTVNE